MIRSIRLQQFRSYDDRVFDLGSAVTVIVGPNASGKTNLLEAVLVAARGSSYRVRDQDLIMFDMPWARVDAETDGGRRTVKLTAEPQPGKGYELDGKAYKRLLLAHTLPVVLFEPNDLQLLHGPPDGRRTYLDTLLEQTEANHATMLRNYRRTLAQRNALLKRAKRPNNEELFPWNLRLSELGAFLSRRRALLVERIEQSLGATYRNLAQSTTPVSIQYHAQFPLENYESRLLQKLEADLPIDVLRGFTAAGPHREDFGISFAGRPADETASRGETRTAILALKILELQLLTEARGQSPILLLDDVFSELDASRRHALTNYVREYQTLITTTDADVVQQNLAGHCQTITLA